MKYIKEFTAIVLVVIFFIFCYILLSDKVIDERKMISNAVI